MYQNPDKQIKIKELSVLQKALTDVDSLKKHLETYHIDTQEENKGYTLLHQAVDQLDKVKETQADSKNNKGQSLPYQNNRSNQNGKG